MCIHILKSKYLMHVVGKVPWKTRGNRGLRNNALMQCAHKLCHMIQSEPVYQYTNMRHREQQSLF